MLCERCGIREANIQYTEVINGVKKEHHFCAQCAKEMDFGPYSAIFDGEFPLGKLLSGLLGIEDTSRVPDSCTRWSVRPARPATMNLSRTASSDVPTATVCSAP